MENIGMRHERDVELFGGRAVLYALARDGGALDARPGDGGVS
jgi:hypothetical protein